MYRLFFKRFFDLVLSLFFFILISPLFLILTILVMINMGFPVFFTQERSGKNQKAFKLIKFRTMKNDKDASGELLPDEVRQTKFGNWLRSTSLDELPELLNIIIGRMSIIGPRPLPVFYNPYYRESELNRFDVRGGLITPDAIDDTPIISWDKQFIYESEYAKNISFKNDFKIFFSVFKMLFKRKKENYGEYIRDSLDVERSGENEN